MYTFASKSGYWTRILCWYCTGVPSGPAFVRGIRNIWDKARFLRFEEFNTDRDEIWSHSQQNNILSHQIISRTYTKTPFLLQPASTQIIKICTQLWIVIIIISLAQKISRVFLKMRKNPKRKTLISSSKKCVLSNGI